MKFGVFDHMDASGAPLGQQFEERLRIVEAYDRGGFYAYHVAEHHATPLGVACSPSVYFSAVAQRTKNLRFGPLVYLLPFYHPLRLIEEICMLDHMSGGRFQLGVGRGVSPPETASYGLDFNETQTMYHEAFQVVIKGLTSDELSFAGQHYRFDKVPMVLHPLQHPHPPLWYGYGVPDNAPWPAQNDVNVVTLGLRPQIRALVTRYHEERAKAGKDPKAVPLIGVARHTVVAETDADALRIARRAYPRWRDSFFWLWEKRGGAPRIGALYPKSLDELHSMGNAIVGSPATVRDLVAKEIEETGINYFIAWPAFGEIKIDEALHSIDLFAREVMPAFAGPAAR